MALSKDQILSARDFKTKEVPVPEWGGDILVRSLDGAGRDKNRGSVSCPRRLRA